MAPSLASRSRFLALDGLRGLAALVVFAHHALVLLYGPLAGVNEHQWDVRPEIVHIALQTTPIAWVFNGTFAVSFFFVLSGFVLTRAMGIEPAATRVAQLCTTRFLRLFPLVALGTLLGLLTFGAGKAHLDALLMLRGNDSHAYMHQSLLLHHGVKDALMQMFVDIWRGSQADRLLDPPLWSIGVELKGSLLVYWLAGAFAGTRNRLAMYVIGALSGLAFIGPDSLSFLAGMALAERSIRHEGPLWPFSSGLLVALAGLSFVWASVHPWDRSLWLPLPVALPAVADTTLSTLCACVLLLAGLFLPWLRAGLESRVVQYLGHASYGLYVVHVPILYVLCAPTLRLAHAIAPAHTASVFVGTALLALSLVIGHGLVTYVDTPLAKWSKGWSQRALARALP